MPKYKPTFRHHNTTFTEMDRIGDVVLYEGTSLSGFVQYEVHVLRLKRAHPMSAEAGTKVLSSPSDSEWGTRGFTLTTKERAMDKFNDLVSLAAQKAHSCVTVAPVSLPR